MSLIPRISVKVLGPLFGTRYRLASLTRRSKTFNRIITSMFFEGDDMIVLPKDDVVKTRRIETDIRIEDAGETTVLPSDVVKGIIERSSDIFIMNFCLCRKSNKCEDYPREKGCVFLGKGVHKIPEDFGHLATAEEAKAYIDECTELGLVHIIGRNKLDSIWLDTGDKKDLMTICNCCPCCCLWNMARNISDDIGSSFKRMDGVTVTVDADECIGCGLCRDICFIKAITIDSGRCSLNQDACRGCGRCVEVCPRDAIRLDFDQSVVTGEIERISDLVNL
jgi:ferredoxin